MEERERKGKRVVVEGGGEREKREKVPRQGETKSLLLRQGEKPLPKMLGLRPSLAKRSRKDKFLLIFDLEYSWVLDEVASYTSDLNLRSEVEEFIHLLHVAYILSFGHR
ncbi:hypothetical protein VNO80_15587 [Phaseolus coccineus]|uniref:Uncharacterized protein n=1 Tax=Phaseolus coccineus TaxID=3886 RepID=A0AAN9MRP9_PHACN